MWSKVEKYIDNYKLLESNELYIVALSGGADSVALLLLLHEHGFRVHAAHCNFRLRGAESDRDEAFCESLCEERHIPFHRAHFDTHEYAQLHKFEQLRQDIGAAGVCVAHHRDDSVETVLLNLIRGTGLRGLTGIQPRNGYILRPLLCVSREDIEQYLRERNQPYVTDSTNLEADVQRNKVRLQLLPLLKTLNPSVCESIQQTASHLAEAQTVLDAVNEESRRCNTLEISALSKYGSSEYVVFEWLKNYGFNGTQAQQILTAETGRVFSSSLGYDLLRDRDRLIVEPSLKPLKPLRIPEEGTYVMEDGTRITLKETVVGSDFQPSKEPDLVTLDADKVAFPLTVRRVEPGDSMHPFGMRGRKLLSDLMTDLKMTLFEKHRQLMVVDAEGIVVWLVGLRTDNRCRVDRYTHNVLTISRQQPRP